MIEQTTIFSTGVLIIDKVNAVVRSGFNGRAPGRPKRRMHRMRFYSHRINTRIGTYVVVPLYYMGGGGGLFFLFFLLSNRIGRVDVSGRDPENGQYPLIARVLFRSAKVFRNTIGHQ